MASSVVGFFDILGTKNAVIDDRFSDTDILEFVNAIVLAADLNPTIRFAVFSDSVIISGSSSETKPLLRAVNFMYANWFSELVYVRGAISCGDIHWLDDPSFDTTYQSLPNLTYARVYGKGLVDAYNLEHRSGPGAICFLTKETAELLLERESLSVLESNLPLLCWATEQQAKACQVNAKLHLERTRRDTDEWRHATATKYYFDTVVSQTRFLPESYSK